MAKAKRYSTEQIQAAQKQLRALSSKKSGKTKKEVMELLAEDVRKAVKDGHSLKAIQDMLRQVDIPVSLAQMKALMPGMAAEFESLLNPATVQNPNRQTGK